MRERETTKSGFPFVFYTLGKLLMMACGPRFRGDDNALNLPGALVIPAKAGTAIQTTAQPIVIPAKAGTATQTTAQPKSTALKQENSLW
ncbi:MAG: hypothetical protein A2X22_03540 [Bacteroidetes bacterium GWF2_49_14]|nr:MAG: hypothetical protein A2X22_03540 [Bacteroidetes bacterium GWF2_49_14]HBB92831.1 hypothetical protein [Bacteroidales bacterium]